MNKKELIEMKLSKIKSRIIRLHKLNKIENCLALISVYCDLQYRFNQVYSDADIELLVSELSKEMLKSIINYKSKRDTVLFYDGFGLDLRGWAVTYVKALNVLGYKVIYITSSKSKDRIPHIIDELGENNIVEYINTRESYITWINDLFKLFLNYQPKSAFLYTTPNDVAGALVFNRFKDLVTRIQIDLTDHAFWLGINSVDYFLESRELGASLAIYERHVDKNSIIKIDSAPYINRDKYTEPLPFDIESTPYIFTGGSLYKTLGDEHHLYYKIVDSLLTEFTDLFYLYAGSGDNTEIDKILKKYPNRAFLIGERPDFFRLIENSVFYLNSYPMFGGLMMRFAALAKKVPLTLKHEHDADGILENQNLLNIEFENIDDLLVEARKLITNNEYRESQGLRVINNVITDEIFARNIYKIIEEQQSEYSFETINKIDTSEFQKEYVERFDLNDFYKVLVSKINKGLMYEMPVQFFKGYFIKLKERRTMR